MPGGLQTRHARSDLIPNTLAPQIRIPLYPIDTLSFLLSSIHSPPIKLHTVCLLWHVGETCLSGGGQVFLIVHYFPYIDEDQDQDVTKDEVSEEQSEVETDTEVP